ncbi:MAG: hypothetical protein M3Y26_11805 [Actinomycetota bacterium]|nr:hypothetical protein [Actinomycetota bacterium]
MMKRSLTNSRQLLRAAVVTSVALVFLAVFGRMSRVPWNFGGGPLIVRPR